MPQKREGECGVVADATERLVDDLLGLVDGVETEIGELAALQIAPDLFDRIEVGRIAREPFDHQPSSLVLEEGLHGSAAMRRKAVPDQGELVAVRRLNHALVLEDDPRAPGPSVSLTWADSPFHS